MVLTPAQITVLITHTVAPTLSFPAIPAPPPPLAGHFCCCTVFDVVTGAGVLVSG